MSGTEVMPRRVDSMRCHDYLYDSTYIVSGARDYARTAFKAAMDSAQVNLQPVFKTMFSNLRQFPPMKVVYSPNCRLPQHLDRSYAAYMLRQKESRMLPTPQLAGRDQYKFINRPKEVLEVPKLAPDFQPPPPTPLDPGKPFNRGTQSVYRESSAQTVPWQPDAQAATCCESTPEVMFLEKLEWGPGKPFRNGDLPVDFHTTEIINKLRHARQWSELAEKGQFPRWMKKRDAIITDVETKDWIFREAEIDELQDIRLELLHNMQNQQRAKHTSHTTRKLTALWTLKKQQMDNKIQHIRRTRDRELRKLNAKHSGGGRLGQVERMRAARGGGSVTKAAAEPTSELHAPLARHGYQARTRHAEIYYDPSLLELEDHEMIAEPPHWLDGCGQNLGRTCSGHHLRPDPMQLCERETKWSEAFLASLHNDLKMARLGAAKLTAGPLHVLKPRHVVTTPRPRTPEVDMVQDDDEVCHQAALTLQRIIRGRAVQTLMYEGRTRAAELTEELKTTHGLQKEDQVRIAREEARARDHHVVRTDADQKEDAITALVDELCGGAVAAALDFLEKELRRLKEERRQHAFILIALREKVMREAEEAGRRQKEEQRRREHDEMFRQVLGMTQATVDAYLHDVIAQGVELAAEKDAVQHVQAAALHLDRDLLPDEAMSTAEKNELVAELVQQFLLPEAHKCASRMRISSLQQARTETARKTIFGILDDAEIKFKECVRCGRPLNELCQCTACNIVVQPTETRHRHDPRWAYTRGKPANRVTGKERVVEKREGEKFPATHEFRYLANAIVDDAVAKSKQARSDACYIQAEYSRRLREIIEAALDARDWTYRLVDRVTGVEPEEEVSRPDYKHFMVYERHDALERTEGPLGEKPCPTELPSEKRKREEKLASYEHAPAPAECRCDLEHEQTRARARSHVRIAAASPPDSPPEKPLLPSELRQLEELRNCKCDRALYPHPSHAPHAPHAHTDDDTDTAATASSAVSFNSSDF